MILFEPHPKQKEFIDAVFSKKYKYLLFGGAAGGGKSFVSLATLILMNRIYAGSKSFVIRESLPTLKRTTIPSFFKLCPTQFIHSYNQTDQIVRFRNGSSLTFFPENYEQDKNLTRFDGIEANFFLIEEAQECQQKTFEKCKLRAGRNIINGIDNQPEPVILITCNPSQNWTKEVFHKPFIDGTLPPDYFYMQSLMHHNPSLPKSYIDGLENIDPITKSIFVDGNWDVIDVEKPFAYSFNQSKNVRTGLAIDKNHPVLLSFDFNVDPITCIAGQSFENKIRILKEFRLRNSDVFELCHQIKTAFGNHHLIITGDASGSNRSAMTKGAMNYYIIIKDELDIPKSSFKVPSFNPSIKNSRILLNSILDKHPDFAIDKSCQFLINDLQQCQVDSNGEIDKKADKTLSHLLDCFRYYLFTFHSDFVKYLK